MEFIGFVSLRIDFVVKKFRRLGFVFTYPLELTRNLMYPCNGLTPFGLAAAKKHLSHAPERAEETPERLTGAPERVEETRESLANAPEYRAGARERVEETHESLVNAPEYLAGTRERVAETRERLRDAPECPREALERPAHARESLAHAPERASHAFLPALTQESKRENPPLMYPQAPPCQLGHM